MNRAESTPIDDDQHEQHACASGQADDPAFKNSKKPESSRYAIRIIMPRRNNSVSRSMPDMLAAE